VLQIPVIAREPNAPDTAATVRHLQVVPLCVVCVREWFQRLVNLMPLDVRSQWLDEMPRKT